MRKLILIVLFGITGQLFSQSAITVLFTSNKVVAKHNGAERSISRGSSLSAGDSVITGAKAAANIKYSNGTLINLGENSHYTIVSYAPKQAVQLKTKLESGKIHLKTNGKSKEEVTTPIVALAILGTDASIFVASAKTTYVNVTQGTVQGKGGTVKTGDSALFNKDGSSFAPFPKEGAVSPPAGAAGTITSSSGATTGSPTSGPTNNTEIIALTTIQTLGTTTTAASTVSTEVVPISIISCP